MNIMTPTAQDVFRLISCAGRLGDGQVLSSPSNIVSLCATVPRMVLLHVTVIVTLCMHCIHAYMQCMHTQKHQRYQK